MLRAANKKDKKNDSNPDKGVEFLLTVELKSNNSRYQAKYPIANGNTTTTPADFEEIVMEVDVIWGKERVIAENTDSQNKDVIKHWDAQKKDDSG